MVLSLSFAALQPNDISLCDCGSEFEQNFQNQLRDALINFCECYELDFPVSVSKDVITLFMELVRLLEVLNSPVSNMNLIGY